MYLWIILMLLCVFADQISKYLVVIYMELGESADLIPGVFRFTYIRNEGAAFGSLSDSRWVFMIISTVAIIAILVYFFWKKPQSKLTCTAISLIVGGGIGNMIDRVRLGYVVDFLDFCAFPNVWKYVFNIADALVCVGCGLVLLQMIIDLRRDIIEEKKQKNIPVQGKETDDHPVDGGVGKDGDSACIDDEGAMPDETADSDKELDDKTEKLNGQEELDDE